jgi:hypothetical protein
MTDNIIRMYERMIEKGQPLTPIQQAEYDKACAALAAEHPQIPAEPPARDGESPHVAATPPKPDLNSSAVPLLRWFMLDAFSWADDYRLFDLTDRQFSWLFWLRVEAWKRKCRLPNKRNLLVRFARVTDPYAEDFDAEFGHVLETFFRVSDTGELEDFDMIPVWMEKTQKYEEAKKNGQLSQSMKATKGR